jgi:hypothetical protein
MLELSERDFCEFQTISPYNHVCYTKIFVKCKILTNGIRPNIAGVNQRGTPVIIYTNWKVLTETITTFVVIIYRRDMC